MSYPHLAELIGLTIALDSFDLWDTSIPWTWSLFQRFVHSWTDRVRRFASSRSWTKLAVASNSLHLSLDSSFPSTEGSVSSSQSRIGVIRCRQTCSCSLRWCYSLSKLTLNRSSRLWLTCHSTLQIHRWTWPGSFGLDSEEVVRWLWRKLNSGWCKNVQKARDDSIPLSKVCDAAVRLDLLCTAYWRYQRCRYS